MSSFPALKKRINNGEITGFCDSRFERVAEEFERNFQQRDELGASVCVTLEGERVVNVCNTPSPAATASLQIGEAVVDRLTPRFG